MKKLLRNMGLVERGGGGVILKRGGPNCFISFSSEKHVLITIETLFSLFYCLVYLPGNKRENVELAVINISIISCGLLSTRK